MTETRQEFCTPALVVSGMRVCVRYGRCVRFSIPSSTGSDVCELIDHNTPRIDVMSLIFRCLSKHRVICLVFVRHCLRRVSPGSHSLLLSSHTLLFTFPHSCHPLLSHPARSLTNSLTEADFHSRCRQFISHPLTGCYDTSPPPKENP